MRSSLEWPWLVPASAASLFCLTQWLAFSGLNQATVGLAIVGAFFSLLLLFFPSYRWLAPSFFVIALIGFPEYAADPYRVGYVAPFSLGKLPALVCLAAMARPTISVSGLLFALLLCVATLGAVIDGRIGPAMSELWYAALVLFVMNSRSHVSANDGLSVVLDALERLFYLLVPICLFILATGMYDERAGDTTVFFYGHWLGIVSALAIYSAVSGRSSVLQHSVLRFAALSITLFVCSTSFQTGHFVLFLLVTGLALWHVKKRLAAVLVPASALAAMFAVGVWVMTTADTGSWLYLKISQLFAFFSGEFEAANSVTIRISQLLSLIEQGSLWTLTFGRGVMSTYLPEGAYWGAVLLHENTYPEPELLVGEFQYIHEPLVLLFKWTGLAGVALVAWATLRAQRDGTDEHLRVITATFFLLFFAGSFHTGILVGACYILSKRTSYGQASDRYSVLGGNGPAFRKGDPLSMRAAGNGVAPSSD